MWHISNTQQEKGAQPLLICRTIYPSSSFYPVQACKGQEPISCQRAVTERQSLVYQTNLEPVNPTQVLWFPPKHRREHADTTQLFLLKCFCAHIIFIPQSIFSQLLIILQFAGKSLIFKYRFNKSRLLQANFSPTVKADLEAVWAFSQSSGWCAVLRVHKTAQTLQQWISMWIDSRVSTAILIADPLDWVKHVPVVRHVQRWIKEAWFKIEWQCRHSTPPEKMYF